MLTESSLYLSTCALEWWQQIVSAVQKHLDKFTRPLVHKWMQNYLAGVCPAVPLVPICWSSAGGVKQRKPRLVLFQILLGHPLESLGLWDEPFQATFVKCQHGFALVWFFFPSYNFLIRVENLSPVSFPYFHSLLDRSVLHLR